MASNLIITAAGGRGPRLLDTTTLEARTAMPAEVRAVAADLSADRRWVAAVGCAQTICSDSGGKPTLVVRRLGDARAYQITRDLDGTDADPLGTPTVRWRPQPRS